MERYLRPTPIIDSDNQAIQEKARGLTETCENIPGKARNLFYFVRDDIKYNIYVLSDRPEYYVASQILELKQGFCVQKAVLLAALARAVGIPARLHLAAIRNHLVPNKLKEFMGGNIFPTHGYDELYIEGKWVKVAPTFHLGMCQQNRLVPVEFDGKHDAVLPAYNLDGKPHIEYIEDRGFYEDLPFEKIYAWRIQTFGPDFFDRMRQLIEDRKTKG